MEKSTIEWNDHMDWDCESKMSQDRVFDMFTFDRNNHQTRIATKKRCSGIRSTNLSMWRWDRLKQQRKIKTQNILLSSNHPFDLHPFSYRDEWEFVFVFVSKYVTMRITSSDLDDQLKRKREESWTWWWKKVMTQPYMNWFDDTSFHYDERKLIRQTNKCFTMTSIHNRRQSFHPSISSSSKQLAWYDQTNSATKCREIEINRVNTWNYSIIDHFSSTMKRT